MKKFQTWSLICVSFLWLKNIHAEEAVMIERSWDFGIGMGYGEQSNPFVGADDVPGYVTLDLAIYGERFFFDNGELGLTLMDEPGLGVNVIANYSSERIYYSFFNELGILTSDTGVSGNLSGMGLVPVDRESDPLTSNVIPFELPDRDFAAHLGLELLMDRDWGHIQLQATTDVSGVHKGQDVLLEYSYGWGTNRWAFKPSITLNWKSAELVDYYYGFDDLVENVDFSYRGGATLNYSVGFVASYRINNHLSFVTQIKGTQLGSKIRQSPIIKEDTTQSFFSGLFYRF